MKQNLTIPILDSFEFRNLLMDHLTNDKKDWTTKDIMDYILESGFPKLNFDRLNECLPKCLSICPPWRWILGTINLFGWYLAAMPYWSRKEL